MKALFFIFLRCLYTLIPSEQINFQELYGRNRSKILKRNKIIFLIIFILTGQPGFTQGVFQKAIYGQFSTNQSITKPTSDGGYILVGQKYSAGLDEDIFLIKMDANGDTMWTRTYLRPGIDIGEDVIQTMDGGYFIAAWQYVLKTDSLGNPQWAKTISFSTWDDYNK